ncbi:hypothetical protein FQR65_LT09160 [Abscondita terminalis]|nr:hypothetical protein FQR65_LT09160 [Abscondita terminalis]
MMCWWRLQTPISLTFRLQSPITIHHVEMWEQYSLLRGTDFEVHHNLCPVTESLNVDISVSPAELLPVPKVCQNITKKKRSNTGKAALVTSTPYKEELETSLTKRSVASTSKVVRNITSSVGSRNKSAQQKNNLEKKKGIKKRKVSSSSSSESEVEVTLDDGGESPFTEDEDDAECIFCNDLFSKDCAGEKWIRCAYA